MCRRYAILNLHPALPAGPTGTWQEVIWQLLEHEATETGAMIHLRQRPVDRGPVISYFRFPLAGEGWDASLGAVPREAAAASVPRSPPPRASPSRSSPNPPPRRGPRDPAPLPDPASVRRGQLATSNGAVFAESSRLPMDLTAMVEGDSMRGA